MRASLERWVGDLDARGYLDLVPGAHVDRLLEPVRDRFGDYYLSLVGALFELLRSEEPQRSEFALLGNALADIGGRELPALAADHGISLDEARMFGAAAFYMGGYPASAQLVARSITGDGADEADRTCVEMLLRPPFPRSETVGRILGALRRGDLADLEAIRGAASESVMTALNEGPEAWIRARLLHGLMDQFDLRNVRAVLPDGSDTKWDGLVASFLTRRPPVWEFFPSQVRAIESGLLTSDASFALEMPTGAGKTALCETLLYYHAQSTPGSLGVLLVPYRSLASELRRTMVRRLSSVGVRSACMYGGTVPTQGEATVLADVSVLVATPESLSGLLGADPGLYRRVSLLICDEGHLLDRDSRGIALELLLARMRSRASGPPRFVFISAIVPNAHEINAWLGGTDRLGARRKGFHRRAERLSVGRAPGDLEGQARELRAIAVGEEGIPALGEPVPRRVRVNGRHAVGPLVDRTRDEAAPAIAPLDGDVRGVGPEDVVLQVPAGVVAVLGRREKVVAPGADQGSQERHDRGLAAAVPEPQDRVQRSPATVREIEGDVDEPSGRRADRVEVDAPDLPHQATTSGSATLASRPRSRRTPSASEPASSPTITRKRSVRK